MSWPSHYPELCPPGEAAPTTGIVYRLVDLPMTNESFKSHYEQDPDKHAGNCIACGLSVYRDREDAVTTRRRYKKGMAGKRIAKGLLDENAGRIMPTKGLAPTHSTWWVAPDCNPSPMFELDE